MTRSNKGAIADFKRSNNAVLFASGAMWEGVDCAGDCLSSVIIARLPYPLRSATMEQKKTLYIGHLKKLILLFLIMTIALISLTLSIGMYRYNEYFDAKITKLQEISGTYLMIFDSTDESFDSSVINETIQSVHNMPGVKSVETTKTLSAEYNGDIYTIVSYNEFLNNYFFPEDVTGEWISNNNAVISKNGVTGNILNNSISLKLYLKQQEPVIEQVRISGLLNKGSYLPRFSRSSNQMSIYKLLYHGYGTKAKYIIVSEESDIYKKYHDSFDVYRNLLVTFEDDITKEEKDNVYTFLQSQGLLVEFNEMLNYTQAEWKEATFNARYMILFSTMTLILAFSISLTIIQDINRELAIYSICGCSKAKKILLSIFGMIMVSGISLATQSILLLNFYSFNLNEYFDNVIIDDKNILFVAGYCLLAIAAAVIATCIFNKSKRTIHYLQENRK